MLIKTRGIVFRSLKYRETSLILDIYTEAKGLRKYIINGVRSPKAKTKANMLRVMSLVDLLAYEREDRDLQRIKEVRPALVYQSTPFDVRKGAVGLFMAEVARKSIRESEENVPLFNFLFDSFCHLDHCQEHIANLHLFFMTRLSYFLGFAPNGHYSEQTPIFDLKEGSFVNDQADHRYFMPPIISAFFDQLLDIEQDQCHRLKISNQDRRVLLEKLLEYYRLHLENFPEIKAHLILQEILG